MKLRPMLQVRDVGVSSRWYQTTIGLSSGHGGDEFEMLFAGDEFVLQLHRLDAHEHGLLQPAPDVLVGAGVSLWFETADRYAFDSLIGQARIAGTMIAEEPKWNPFAHHHESTRHRPTMCDDVRSDGSAKRQEGHKARDAPSCEAQHRPCG